MHVNYYRTLTAFGGGYRTVQALLERVELRWGYQPRNTEHVFAENTTLKKGIPVLYISVGELTNFHSITVGPAQIPTQYFIIECVVGCIKPNSCTLLLFL